MSVRTVTLRTASRQRPYGDTFLQAEVDFHLKDSEFGGAPPAEAVIRVVKALWPTADRVELTARPHPDARTTETYGKVQADIWIITGRIDYRG